MISYVESGVKQPYPEVEILRGLNQRHFFTRENVTIAENRSGEDVYKELASNSQEALREALKILNSQEFQELIQTGHITFGAIKPRVHRDSTIPAQNDLAAAYFLENEILSPLQVIFSFSFQFSPDLLKGFYPPEVWKVLQELQATDTFTSYMTSGPETGLILFSPLDSAVTEWRHQIGSTNPRIGKKKHENSIRARFAKHTRQNLVHGSSSIPEAQREIQWLSARISSFVC